MSKNKIIIVAALIVLAAGAFYAYKKMNNEESNEGYKMDASTNDNNGDETSLKVPAPGEDGEGITEMIVNDNEANSEVKEFIVEGGNFVFSLKEIRVNQGDKVKIVFNNTEGFHDLIIDEYNVNTGQIKSEQSRTVEFVADKTGTFEYYCSVGQHRANGMFGKLIVE